MSASRVLEKEREGGDRSSSGKKTFKRPLRSEFPKKQERGGRSRIQFSKESPNEGPLTHDGNYLSFKKTFA